MYRFLLLSLLITQAALAGDIPVISQNPNGQPNVRLVPNTVFSGVVDQAVRAVHESLLPELSCSQNTGKSWKLDTIIVGVGISGQIGLGPIISLQAKPRIRLLYSRADQPTFPIQ